MPSRTVEYGHIVVYCAVHIAITFIHSVAAVVAQAAALRYCTMKDDGIVAALERKTSTTSIDAHDDDIGI
jgi:hypothetical protein